MQAEKLLIGFDSAWSAANRGALVAAVVTGQRCVALAAPQLANFQQALQLIQQWQAQWQPKCTWVGIDQPVIVPNEFGQRPVEHVLCALISRRRGGIQPAYRAKANLFGDAAPIWQFLAGFSGAPTQLKPAQATQVFEVYPTLLLLHLGWLSEDHQGRPVLPKYNPANARKFQHADWVRVCQALALWLQPLGEGVSVWVAHLTDLAQLDSPRKADQDQLDALLCWVSVWYRLRGEAWQLGNAESGFLLSPCQHDLRAELLARIHATGRDPEHFLAKI